MGKTLSENLQDVLEPRLYQQDLIHLVMYVLLFPASSRRLHPTPSLWTRYQNISSTLHALGAMWWLLAWDFGAEKPRSKS